jgi:hypothetical protein
LGFLQLLQQAHSVVKECRGCLLAGRVGSAGNWVRHG